MNGDRQSQQPPLAHPPDEGGRQEFIWLHLLRGLAALAVMAGHARGFVLVDYGVLPDPGLAAAAFYFATSLGHQAVIVFFVLSGFLIAGSVLDRAGRGTWSWPDYATARLSRLWVVLIPSLVATLLWDRLGMAIAPDGFYSGDLNGSYHSGPVEPGGVTHAFSVFLANVLFLQTIVAPTFGSNGPLWSLANEFWYYVLFPLAYFALSGRQSGYARICLGAGALAIGLLLPRTILVLGLTWLFGAVAAVWHQREAAVRSAWRPAAAAGVAILFAIWLAGASLMLPHHLIDIVTGAWAAVLVAALVRVDIQWSPLRLLARFLSRMSYTMYLFHFPLFAFLAVGPLGQQKMPFTASGVAVFAAFMALGAGYSWIAYLAFERHTGWVRSQMTAFAGNARRPVPVRNEP